ncbi:hypothetical protein N7476_009671 [Penicillium atrosanguineum]|uniref:Uncharacterized protein n=1 Tax=Penicillium atrosanguineum TaxID=1132637 RepID=A0A9W9PNT1_9EURO|nr:hypothetical protein N7476_009671 [Penicillium atrosanguineum]
MTDPPRRGSIFDRICSSISRRSSQNSRRSSTASNNSRNDNEESTGQGLRDQLNRVRRRVSNATDSQFRRRSSTTQRPAPREASQLPVLPRVFPTGHLHEQSSQSEQGKPQETEEHVKWTVDPSTAWMERLIKPVFEMGGAFEKVMFALRPGQAGDRKLEYPEMKKIAQESGDERIVLSGKRKEREIQLSVAKKW